MLTQLGHVTRSREGGQSEMYGICRKSTREVLAEAIACGSTVPLDFAGAEKRDRLFYYGSATGTQGFEERLRVYNRADEPCNRCATSIRKITQAGRSTYYCPQCQRG